MNKSQLVQIISKRTSLVSDASLNLLNALEEKVAFALFKGERVNLANFGSLYTKKTKSRAIPNPKNPGHKIITLGKMVIKFRPSDNFKNKVKIIKLPQVLKAIEPKPIPKPNKEISIPIRQIPAKEKEPTPPKEEPPKPETQEEKLLKLRTRPLKISFIELKNRKIPKEILAKIPERIARTYKIVPVEVREGKLVVAMINPEDLEAIEFVKKKTGMELKIGITTEAELESIFDQYAGAAKEIEKAIEAIEEEEKEVKKGAKKPAKAEAEIETPVTRLVNSILTRAIRDKASDIHVEPQERELSVRYRIDGVLQKAVTLPLEIHPGIVARLKVMSNLKIDETRMPQDGRFTLAMNSLEVDFRVSSLPTVFGEKIVLRILDKSKGLLTLEELGVVGRSFEIINENIHKAHGMTLVTGPTGSGKTTTLYAILDKISNVGINIVTLEDPVEYRLHGINQSQVNHAVDYTFATGLRSIVRQDPDVVMVGEIRDTETASIAIHAALTGHVVLSTLHTNDAAGAIPRLIDMKIEPFLIASSLNLVVAQRLCRKICDNCKTSYNPVASVVQEIRKEILNMPKFEQEKLKNKKMNFSKGKGCPICNDSGYKGRIGIFEVLSMTDGIKGLIMEKVSGDTIAAQAKKEGMLTLKQDGIKKVIEGATTVEEVWRVTKE